MATKTVYPYGMVDITVPAGQYLKVATSGDDYCTIFYGTTAVKFPLTYYKQQDLTNNEVTLGAMTVEQPVRIYARADPVFYDYGAAPIILVPTYGVLMYNQNAPVALTGAAMTLTAAAIQAGMVTVASGAGATTLTTLTGALMDAAFADFGESDALDFFVINIGLTTEVVTMTAGASGVTVVGDATIGATVDADASLNASSHWRFRRTGTAATWVLYRIA
jgi:hypothetical protein